MNFEDLENKTAYELITENEGIDIVIDTLISEIRSLRERIYTLENN